MSRAKELPHARGDRVTVFWPGGPGDFVIEYERAEDHYIAEPKWADWFIIHGREVEPNAEYGGWRSFYVHPVDGGYALVPYVGAGPQLTA